MTDDHHARAAYAAYGQVTGGLNYQGLALPWYSGKGSKGKRKAVPGA